MINMKKYIILLVAALLFGACSDDESAELIIKEKAENECFVIVGRCADYILRNQPNVVKVFIYADMESRIKRAVDRREIDPARAKQAVIKTDKNRANYYSFYSGQKWGQADNFDLCINSTKLTIEQAVDVIAGYVDIIS